MAVFIKHCCALLFLSVLYKGNCQCSLDSIAIGQTSTGSLVQGKMEWKATVSNNCHCSQYDVKLDCNGFKTAKNIDPSILAIAGTECLVNNGAPIFDFKPITFTYAWDNPFPFQPIFSQIACS